MLLCRLGAPSQQFSPIRSGNRIGHSMKGYEMLWSDERIVSAVKFSNIAISDIPATKATLLMQEVRDEYEQRIAELEARLTTTETGEGWWIEWHGGYQPVDDNQRVEVKLRDGDLIDDVAGNFAWWRSGDDDDIVAYRVVGGK